MTSADPPIRRSAYCAVTTQLTVCVTTDTTFDLNDYVDNPMVLAMVELERMAALWPDDVRDEVLWVLGELAISCSKGSDRFHQPAAEFLTASRRLIRAAAEYADDYRTAREA